MTSYHSQKNREMVPVCRIAYKKKEAVLPETAPLHCGPLNDPDALFTRQSLLEAEFHRYSHLHINRFAML